MLYVSWYYCGYTFKGQVVGRKFLLQASRSLDYMEPQLAHKSDGQRWHRIANRLLVDFQHRCISRPAAEEWNLAVNHHDQDVTNAEMNRTFRSVSFPGGQCVKRLEEEMNRQAKRVATKLLPTPRSKTVTPAKEDAMVLKYYPELYGFRGPLATHEAVYYLNMWEFLMLWEVRRLPKPTKKGKLSDNEASPGCAEHAVAPPLTIWATTEHAEGNEDFILNPAAETFYRPRQDIFFYLAIKGNTDLRNTWYLRKRQKPHVPSPSNTPMPDKHSSKEHQARLYAVYSLFHFAFWYKDPGYVRQLTSHSFYHFTATFKITITN
jgi:hypothetical protein